MARNLFRSGHKVCQASPAVIANAAQEHRAATGGSLDGDARANWKTWDLPDWGLPCPVKTGQPIAVIRPATLRQEWFNSARNPKPEYISEIAEQLMASHCVVSVADCDAGETLVGPKPPCHVELHRGELPMQQLLTLARHADVLVGGVGWIVPASIALKVKAFVILGGHGAHNAPQIITDPAMDLTRIFFAQPAKFCRCTNMRHNCEKDIPDLLRHWQTFCGMPAMASGSDPAICFGMTSASAGTT
jgi:hypothetical protein